MRERPARPHRRLLAGHEDDPLNGLANLFDVAMVFSVAILLSLFARAPLLGLVSQKDVLTILKNAGQPDMEVIHHDGKRLEHYRVSEHQLQGQGKRLGIAYRLENGEVVYVPSPD